MGVYSSLSVQSKLGSPLSGRPFPSDPSMSFELGMPSLPMSSVIIFQSLSLSIPSLDVSKNSI